MMLPKIEFRKMTLEENINLIKWMYFDDNESLNIHEKTIQYFKELNSIDQSLSKDEIYKIIEKILTKYYINNEFKINSEVLRYSKVWEKYNDKYYEILIKYLNIDWPKDKMKIDASVGLLPVFPRYLDNFGFSLSAFLPSSKVIEVCMHESLHFLWFEKWKELYPEISRKEFDSPYLPWKYSEMVTDPILNSQEFKSIIGINEKTYDSFYGLEYNGEGVINKLKNIYLEDIEIEKKIKTGYNYILKVDEKEKSKVFSKK